MGSDGVYGVRGAAQAELSAAVLRRDLSLERAPVVGVRVQRLPYRGVGLYGVYGVRWGVWGQMRGYMGSEWGYMRSEGGTCTASAI